MDYRRLYNLLIEKAKNRPSIEGYTEIHHILPKSMGGNDDVNNLVILTAKEHYIAHRFLSKFTVGRDKYKMIFALTQMLHNKKGKQRFIPSSRIYEQNKKDLSAIQKQEYSKLTAEERSKKFGYMKGKRHNDSTKQKISNATIGRRKTQEHSKNISNARKGMKFSKSHIENVRIALKGVPHTEDRKKNTAIAIKRWWVERKLMENSV